MPKPMKGSPIDIMKAISMFDVETDFSNHEAKQKLSMLFHTLIMSKDPNAKEFVTRFLKNIGNVIADMGIIEKPKDEPEQQGDEVEFPSDDEMGDVAPEDESSEEEPVDDNAPDEVPDDLLSAGFNPLIDRANSFLYI